MEVPQNTWFIWWKIPWRSGWELGVPLWLRKPPYLVHRVDNFERCMWRLFISNWKRTCTTSKIIYEGRQWGLMICCWGTYRFKKIRSGNEKKHHCLYIKISPIRPIIQIWVCLKIGYPRFCWLVIMFAIEWTCYIIPYSFRQTCHPPFWLSHVYIYILSIYIYIISRFHSLRFFRNPIINQHLPYANRSAVLPTLKVHPVSERSKGIARALDHLHVVQHALHRRGVAAEVPRPPGHHLTPNFALGEPKFEKHLFGDVFQSKICGLLTFTYTINICVCVYIYIQYVYVWLCICR